MSDVCVTCGTCGSARVPDDVFCESCGARFEAADIPQIDERSESTNGGTPAGLCSACGGADVDADGYCLGCGMKQPSARDHFEVDLGVVGGVCDRGLRHPVNQDAMDVWSDPATGTHVLVVCDGVSSSSASDVASLAAVKAAASSLVGALTIVPWRGKVALAEAAAAAQAAVVATPFVPTPGLDAPSCTFVAAVVRGTEVIVGWLGDSRAYWLAANEARQVSSDDSWATEMVRSGTLSLVDAEADNRAHQITRWLGADAPDLTPKYDEFTVQEDGLLLLCSDGLWNYASAPEAVAALVAEVTPPSSIAIAKHLCAFANASGGHDNITVVSCHIAISATQQPGPSPSPEDTP